MFLFRSKQFDPDQFEAELKKITANISNSEKKLRRLKSQKKHYQKIIPLYLTTGYIIYFSYVYQTGKVSNSKNIIILILIPLIIGLIYYTFLTFYGYLISNKESYIELLKGEHNEKLIFLKDKTNFDKTKELLARFSDGEDLKEMEKEVYEIRKKKQEYMKMIQDGEKGKVLEDLKRQENSNAGFYDNFLNAILGENELGPDKRYALICENCFSHNGLAAPGSVPSKVKYVCPKCGFLNGRGDIDLDKNSEKGATSEEEDGEKHNGGKSISK